MKWMTQCAIVTGVSTPPDGTPKKVLARSGSGGRKDGSGQRKGSCDKDKKKVWSECLQTRLE